MCPSSKWSEAEPEYCSEAFWSLLLMSKLQLGRRVPANALCMFLPVLGYIVQKAEKGMRCEV